MLILTRKPKQSIMIGEDITITILSKSNHHIKIGIEAPKQVSVHRKEIYQKICAQQQDSLVKNEKL